MYYHSTIYIYNIYIYVQKVEKLEYSYTRTQTFFPSHLSYHHQLVGWSPSGRAQQARHEERGVQRMGIVPLPEPSQPFRRILFAWLYIEIFWDLPCNLDVYIDFYLNILMNMDTEGSGVKWVGRCGFSKIGQPMGFPFRRWEMLEGK